MCKKVYVVIGRFHASIAGFFVVDEINWINIDDLSRERRVNEFKNDLVEWLGFSSVEEYVECYPGEYARGSKLVTREGSAYDYENFLNVYSLDDENKSLGNIVDSLIGDEHNFIIMYPTINRVRLASVAANKWYADRLNPWWCIDGPEVS